MKTPFSKTLSGRFALRSGAVAVAVVLVLAGLAAIALRSLAGAVDAAVIAAQQDPTNAFVELERVASDVSSTSSRFSLIIFAVALIGTLATVVFGHSFAGKVAASIGRLHGTAVESAATIARVDDSQGLEGLDVLTEIPEVSLHSGDEVEDLAHSVAQAQRKATDLAVAQARHRLYSAGQFVTIGRRSQALLREQMSLIEGMERDEANPDNLHRLFQIDHLATRMRRDAESILVLADEPSPRQLRQPVSLHQVVQAASSGIEHFDKVTISDFDGVGVPGPIAADLAHLVAELLENATEVSPPGVTTSVVGTASNDGYLIEIIDHGVGMDPQEIDVINERFARAAIDGIGPHPTPQLGLDIVARLATRHQIRVELVEPPAGGLAARLHIPQAALVDLTAQPQVVEATVTPASPAGEWELAAAVDLLSDGQRHAVDLAIDNSFDAQSEQPMQ